MCRGLNIITLGIFSIQGRGTVVAGSVRCLPLVRCVQTLIWIKVERGVATKGAEVEIIGLGESFKTVLTGIGVAEFTNYFPVLTLLSKRCSTSSLIVCVYRLVPMSPTKELQAEAGDTMGGLLRGIKRERIKRGMVMCLPGSLKSARIFTAQVYVCIMISWAMLQVLMISQVLTKEEGGRFTPFTNGYKPKIFLRTADVEVEIQFPGEPDKMVGLESFPRRFH